MGHLTLGLAFHDRGNLEETAKSYIEALQFRKFVFCPGSLG
jgi:hypothetical protein